MVSRFTLPPDPWPRLVHPSETVHRSGWELDAAERFAARMFDKEQPFPCVFGVDALRRGTLRLSFIGNTDTQAELAATLEEFVQAAPELGKRTSLVAFFEPSPGLHSLDDYSRYFWNLLGGLREADGRPWPVDISQDTEDPHWEFCFAGMPLFIVANTPAHRRRASRHFEYFTITFQPRFVFDDIAATTPQGRNARKIVRGRLREYDAVPPAAQLASFGDPGTREWTQYYLDDDNLPIPSDVKCPLHMASRDGEGS